MSNDWPRPLVHFEIEAIDAERQATFYRELFNWTIGDGDIKTIPAGIGGPEPGPNGQIRQGQQSRVTLYIQVLDIPSSLAKAQELGGSVIFDHFQVEGGATLAAIADPEGNPVMLVQQ